MAAVEKRIIFDGTALTSDTSSNILSLFGNRKEKFNINVSWTAGTGTLDGTIAVHWSGTGVGVFDSNTAKTLTMDSATGGEVFVIDPHEVGFYQIVYTKNTCTSIKPIVTSSKNMGNI